MSEEGKVQLRKDGWWAIFKDKERGPFEFMTAAILAEICLEVNEELRNEKPKLIVLPGGKPRYG